MIEPTCDCCDMPLSDFGALLFSPPAGHAVLKYHVCKPCFDAKFAPLLQGGQAGVTLVASEAGVPRDQTDSSRGG